MDKARVVRIETRIPWRSFRGPSGMWVAICDPLHLTVQGETWSDMTESSIEAVEMLFEELLESGELDKFLARLGWTPVTPLPARGEEARFDVPMKFIEEALADVRGMDSARPHA